RDRARRAAAGGDGRFRARAWRSARRRLRDCRDGPARQPRNEPHFRSRPGPDLRCPGRGRRLDGAAPAAGRRLLRAPQPAADLGAAEALPPQGVRELSEALALLRHLRALLALLCDGVPETAALAGPASATLARCAGAVDFARLDADMVAACARVRAWYDRLIARPARRAGQSRQPTTGEAAR